MTHRTHIRASGVPGALSAVSLAAALAACAGRPPSPEVSIPPAPVSSDAPHGPRLSGGASSEWELAQRVLRALEERDAGALQALRVTESEYKEHVFPEFPEAKGTIPADFHWFHLNVRSWNGIEEAVRRYGGLRFELLDVLPAKGVTKYATYELWNKVELVVGLPDGSIDQIRVFGSLVHMDGVWKILGFPS